GAVGARRAWRARIGPRHRSRRPVPGAPLRAAGLRGRRARPSLRPRRARGERPRQARGDVRRPPPGDRAPLEPPRVGDAGPGPDRRGQRRGPGFLRVRGVEAGAERVATLEPDVLRARVCETLRRMWIGRSRHLPLVIVVEDLQWADTISEEFFASLAEVLAGSPILLVSTY